MTVGVILNPAAGGGRLKREWSSIRSALEAGIGAFALRETDEPGDAAVFGHAFALTGCPLIVAVGGDGTISEVADGILKAQAEGAALPELGVVPAGSGSDLVRTLKLPRDPVAAVSRLAAVGAQRIDAGRVSFVDEDGRLARRHFLNIASLGVSAPIARKVNEDRRKERISATALFYWRTVSELLRYRFQNVRVRIDDGEPMDLRAAMVAAANGGYFGGGMMIAPDATLDDGLLDFVIIRGTSKLGLMMDLRLVYGGRHRNHPAIFIQRGRQMSVEPLVDSGEVLLEADGECCGRIPASFDILPKALKLRF